MGAEEAKVCLYDERLALALEEFCQVAWPSKVRDSRPTTAAAVESASSSVPRPPTILFMKGQKVVGHVATLPVQLWIGSQARSAHWLVGFMVLEEYRNGLIGPLLIKEANRTLDVALSLHVESTVLRIMKGLKWSHQGLLPQFLKVLNASSFAENLQLSGVDAMQKSSGGMMGLARSCLSLSPARWVMGWGIAAAQTLWNGVASLSRRHPSCGEVTEEFGFEDGFTELWETVSKHIGAAVVRDRTYLAARYGRELDRYRLLTCRDHHRKLLGFCLLKTKTFSDDIRMGNMRVGTIVDCLYDPRAPEVWQALLDGAIGMFRAAGSHAVLCTASLEEVQRVLFANGFVAIPGNLNFAIHQRAGSIAELPPLKAWHLMRGDSDADQNF